MPKSETNLSRLGTSGKMLGLKNVGSEKRSKAGSRQGQSKVKARSRQGIGKVKARQGQG